MMLSHSRHLWFLSLLATLLTLSASGDDFYLVRVVFPLESLPQQVLLDDPNSDFLSARKSLAVADGGDKYTPSTCAVNRSCQAGSPRASREIAGPGGPPSFAPHSHLNPPLRC